MCTVFPAFKKEQPPDQNDGCQQTDAEPPPEESSECLFSLCLLFFHFSHPSDMILHLIPLGNDGSDLPAGASERLAQLFDVRIDNTVTAEEIAAPDAVKELIP